MILVLRRKRLKRWLDLLSAVGHFGKEVGFCAIDHVSASWAVLRRFSAIATFNELAHKPSGAFDNNLAVAEPCSAWPRESRCDHLSVNFLKGLGDRL